MYVLPTFQSTQASAAGTSMKADVSTSLKLAKASTKRVVRITNVASNPSVLIEKVPGTAVLAALGAPEPPRDLCW